MASLSYCAERDDVAGSFALEGGLDPSVAIDCDGTYWATVPAERSSQSPDAWSFRCALPPVAAAVVSRVSATVVAGVRVASCVLERQPLRNGLGLRASDVLATNHHPFMAMPWLALNEGLLTVKGMHLPPEGDPAKLDVAFGPGVAYEVSYGRSSPEFREHYWYWPNADRSGLRITIDLGASTRESNPFHFQLRYPRATYAGGGKRSIDVWVPRDLGAFLNAPTVAAQVDRAGAASTAAVATVTAYNAFKTLEALLDRAGIAAGANPSILDWGCGQGRIASQFIAEWPQSRVFGCDGDEQNIAWCRERLDAQRFVVAPSSGPLQFESATFDAIVSVSMMTRLSHDSRAPWLAEMARLLRPGGVALLTYQDRAYVAYASRGRSAEWWSRERSKNQSAEKLRSLCEAHFDVLWIEEAIFGGYQDCFVLRRR